MSALLRLKADIEEALSSLSGHIFVLVETALREHEEERGAFVKTDGEKLTQRKKSKVGSPQKQRPKGDSPQKRKREEEHSQFLETEDDSDPEITVTCRPRKLPHLRPKVSLYRTDEADRGFQDKAAQTQQRPLVKQESDATPKHNSTEGRAPPSGLSCSFCMKVFRHRQNLYRHIQVHTGGKFSCAICSKGFSRKDTLSLHLRTHHPDNEDKDQDKDRDQEQDKDRDQDQDQDQDQDPREEPKREEAPEENTEHDSLCPPGPAEPDLPGPSRDIMLDGLCPPGGAVKKRSKKKKRPKPLRCFCRLCSRGFRCDSELLEHMRSHSGERPFSCPVCKKSFMRKSSLNKHVVVHTGEKPYSCSVCGKCFSRQASRYKHEKLHQKTKSNPKLKPKQEPESDQRPEDQRPEDQTPEDQRSEDQRPEDQRPEDQTPEGQTPEGQTPEGQTPEDPTPEDPTPEDPTPEDPTPEDQIISCGI